MNERKREEQKLGWWKLLVNCTYSAALEIVLYNFRRYYMPHS